MTQVETLRIFFVFPTEEGKDGGYSSEMHMASTNVIKYGGCIEWLKPSECLQISPEERDVFVFDKFEGNAFEKLNRHSSKCVVLGARCLLTCIANGRSIPPNPYPVFTEGMRDLWVTSSGFDKATKKQIQEKVEFMSGYYDNSLRSITTHLVAYNNISTKALHCYKSNIKIMTLSWLEDVWEKSLDSDVNGKDDIFNKHFSPLFNNLSITTSGIAKKEKESLKEVIECNGGRFMGDLKGNVTNIVLLNKPEGEKFKYAKSWNVICVKPTWVYDCVEAKAILSFKSYEVSSNKPKSSTPNKENCNFNFSANFTSNLSVINNMTETNRQLTHLDETTATQRTPKPPLDLKSLHSNVINSILKNLKDAGQFLDGLNIFLYGFNLEDSEKLKQVLNKGGAIRFNELSESVTHIIAGKKDDSLPSLTKHGAYVLSVDWLVECMKLKCRANEAKFLLVANTPNPSEPPSPMSKQGARLLSQTEGKSIRALSLEENDNDKFSQIDELLCRYNASQPGEPLDQPELPPATNSAASTSKPDCSDDFFAGLTFFLSNDLPEEETNYLGELISERKGQIVGKRDLGVPDYAIVPVLGASLTEVTAKEVVNVYFVKDCCIESCLLSPRYYHQPVAYVKNATPLKNCVISVSNYVQGEREFVELLIEALGGVAQSLLARKPKQGASKSTHLICAEPQGQKYEGALRWGLPVVHHDWLLKCAALGIRVSERPYLVGDSKVTEVSLASKTTGEGASNRGSADTPPPPAQVCFPSGLGFKTTPAIARVKATETPKSGNSPDPNRTITPTSPYGAFYGKGNPTPGTRKRIWKWMNQGAEFPVDPPSKPLQEDNSTPVSQLISRHLEMLKRKPEELPPDSPVGVPFKRLNLEEDESQTTAVNSGLEKMKQIKENFTKICLKSSPAAKNVEVEGRQLVVVAESQPHTEVGWEDPIEKEAALENLEKAGSAKPKVFMFSCIGAQLEEAREVVEEGGGIVSSLPYFDKNATHLIAGNLTRAEKLMGSIAAGLWVLHPSYIDALKKAKSVGGVSEEDYEWGSPKQNFRLNLLSSSAKDFALCSYRWRVSIQNGELPPFKDMKMVLHLSDPKHDSFKRLIEAGGGKVVKGHPPNYHETDADLCLYEPVHTPQINFASLASQNIRCVALVFISDILLRKADAIEKNLVPDFLKFWHEK